MMEEKQGALASPPPYYLKNILYGISPTIFKNYTLIILKLINVTMQAWPTVLIYEN